MKKVKSYRFISSRCSLSGNSSGQGMTEYIILVVLIALCAIVVVSLFGKQEKSQFAGMTKALSGEDAIVDTSAVKQAEAEKNITPSLDPNFNSPPNISNHGNATPLPNITPVSPPVSNPPVNNGSVTPPVSTPPNNSVQPPPTQTSPASQPPASNTQPPQTPTHPPPAPTPPPRVEPPAIQVMDMKFMTLNASKVQRIDNTSFLFSFDDSQRGNAVTLPGQRPPIPDGDFDEPVLKVEDMGNYYKITVVKFNGMNKGKMILGNTQVDINTNETGKVFTIRK